MNLVIEHLVRDRMREVRTEMAGTRQARQARRSRRQRRAR